MKPEEMLAVKVTSRETRMIAKKQEGTVGSLKGWSSELKELSKCLEKKVVYSGYKFL